MRKAFNFEDLHEPDLSYLDEDEEDEEDEDEVVLLLGIMAGIDC